MCFNLSHSNKSQQSTIRFFLKEKMEITHQSTFQFLDNTVKNLELFLVSLNFACKQPDFLVIFELSSSSVFLQASWRTFKDYVGLWLLFISFSVQCLTISRWMIFYFFGLISQFIFGTILI